MVNQFQHKVNNFPLILSKNTYKKKILIYHPKILY